MKTFVLLFSLVILWSCEKDLAVLPDNDLETANKQADARVASDEASLYIVPSIHPSERIAIGWDLPSNAYLLSLVIKNEWDGSIISPGLLELLPVEVSLPSTGTYSITLNYKDRIGIDIKSVAMYYHYDASNPSVSGVVSGVQNRNTAMILADLGLMLWCRSFRITVPIRQFSIFLIREMLIIRRSLPM